MGPDTEQVAEICDENAAIAEVQISREPRRKAADAAHVVAWEVSQVFGCWLTRVRKFLLILSLRFCLTSTGQDFSLWQGQPNLLLPKHRDHLILTIRDTDGENAPNLDIVLMKVNLEESNCTLVSKLRYRPQFPPTIGVGYCAAKFHQ